MIDLDASTRANMHDGGGLLPAGDALANMFESHLADSDGGGSKVLTLGWEVIQLGALHGRKFWTQVDASGAVGQLALKRICDAVGVGPIRNTDELHGKPLTISISIERGVGTADRNGVKGYKSAPRLAAPSIQPATSPKNTELPDHLTHIPGLVGIITDWIMDTAKRPQRGLALGAALTLVGTAAGRKVAGPTDSGTHLYILALAPTGAGKDHPLQCISRILAASGMSAHLGPSQFMSMSAVNNHLRQQPLSVCAMDEFGSFLKRVNGPKAANHEQAITGILRSAWGASFGSFMTPAYAGASAVSIVSPAMSMYGASTAEEFYAAVAGADVFNGFLNRFLMIPTKVRPPEQKPLRSTFDIPAEVTDGMARIYSIGGPLLGATSHNVQSNAPAVVVPWADPQAERVYDLLGDQIEAREIEIAFLSRTKEMAVRLATIRAIGVSPHAPRITVEDMEWGRDLALWSAERMIEDASDHMAENDYQRNLQWVRRLIREKPGITQRRLQQSIKGKLKERDREEIIKALIDMGDVRQEVGERPKTGGTPARLFFPCPTIH